MFKLLFSTQWNWNVIQAPNNKQTKKYILLKIERKALHLKIYFLNVLMYCFNYILNMNYIISNIYLCQKHEF